MSGDTEPEEVTATLQKMQLKGINIHFAIV